MPTIKTHLAKVKNTATVQNAENALLQNNKQLLRINFDDGQSASIDMSQPKATVWAKMLDRLQHDDYPVYAEVDANNMITRLCAPIASKVLEIYPANDDGIGVAIFESDAMYSLRRDQPHFEKFYQSLHEAKDTGSKLLITATPVEFDIVDIRPVGMFADEDDSEPEPLEPEPIIPVSPEKCAALFDMINAESCTVDWLESPCITFKFPSSGCNVRAHVMCYMMIDADITPEKMWITGKLNAWSPNVRDCNVGWGWHVAPTLMVTQPGGPPIKMVLDPSLCDKPVTVDYWKSLQNCPTANLHPSEWHFYKYPAHGSATKEEAESDMEDLRLALLEQWTESPPPYNCPPIHK